MKQILLDITKALVEEPDAVTVTEKVSGDTIVLELSVAKHDMGRVIGKEGKIAKSIRTVMRAAGAKDNKRVIVDII
ncbi:MAG: KH domain-containing protein [Clostridia bacterium]|nr:KH domain-containing protein [Clostridia bacterium]